MQYEKVFELLVTKLTHHLSDTQWNPLTKQSYMGSICVCGINKQTNNKFLINAFDIEEVDY